MSKYREAIRLSRRMVVCLLEDRVRDMEDEDLLDEALNADLADDEVVIRFALNVHRESQVRIATRGDEHIVYANVLWYDDAHDVWSVEESHPYGDYARWAFTVDMVDRIEIPGGRPRLFIWLNPPEEVES